MAAIVPAIFVVVFIIAAAKRVNVFSSFCGGAKEGMLFTLRLAPILAGVFIMCELAESSGLADAVTRAASPLTRLLGMPEEITRLAIIKPFSGSGSLSLLTELLKEYGADSYQGRCACVIYASSETVFYVAALYFAGTNKKERALPLAIVILSAVLSAVLSCLLCRIM